MISLSSYADAVRTVIDAAIEHNGEPLGRAADLIAESLRADGVLQAFGTGHSEALAMELTGRAGGLVATNQISLRDVVVYGDADRGVLHNNKLEREPEIATKLYGLAKPRPQDVFVVASQSGINGSVVEFALLVKERGHHLIAITSAQHTERAVPRHPSGLRLSEIADVVLDNGAPYGDALLPIYADQHPYQSAEQRQSVRVGAVSSITSALLAQLLVVEVVRRVQATGEIPPIYLSANVPGGDEHNMYLESRYAGRIRRAA